MDKSFETEYRTAVQAEARSEARASPHIICALMMYGLDYIKKQKANITRWIGMNPNVHFIIYSVLIDTLDTSGREKAEIESELAELGIFRVVFIKNPLLDWIIVNSKLYGEPIHFLSDPLRWLILNELIKISHTAYIIEADVVCITPNWLLDHHNELKEGITIYGTDRACMAYFYREIRAGAEIISEIMRMIGNIYKYLIERNILVGNFDHILMDRDAESKLLTNANYMRLLEKIPETRSSPADIKKFIHGIPFSSMGIGIRHIFGFHIPYNSPELYDPLRVGDIVHADKKEWNSKSKEGAEEDDTQPLGGNKKRKTRRKKRTRRRKLFFS